MDLFLIHGNHLFPINYLNKYKKDNIFVLIENYQFCTNKKYHKLKLLLILSSMRSFGDNLRDNGFKVVYKKIDNSNKNTYYQEILELIKNNKSTCVRSFEIESKKFEKKVKKLLENNDIYFDQLKSPMFINDRSFLKEALEKPKKPNMGNFYKIIRKKSGILMVDDKPIGDKWSYDLENRKKLPKNISIPQPPLIKESVHTKDLKPIVEKFFAKHKGDVNNFFFATTHEDVNKLLDFFIRKKLNLFGDYEDTVSEKDHIIFHSALSPYLNIGLITPETIVERVLSYSDKNNIKINSLEGFLRQIIGWREFMRGIYTNYSEKMQKENFFNHKNSFTESWLEGNTGLTPLDQTLKNVYKNGWSHHIERLMIIANIMNLCEIEPKKVYEWFMEMFVDAYDWVMVPNVYGMGLFSDGGIFSTKPYICGSNYFLKMMDFKKGPWCDTLDGLYWRFIEKNRDFFSKNPRLSMMTRTLDKMNPDRKKLIMDAANNFIKKNTKSS